MADLQKAYQIPQGEDQPMNVNPYDIGGGYTSLAEAQTAAERDFAAGKSPGQWRQPSSDFGFEKFVLPAAMSAIGLGAFGVGAGAGAAEAGATMPAAIAAADPTFGGALTQTAPGVFEAAAPVGAGALNAMGVPNPVTGVPSPTGAPVSPAGPAPTAPAAPTPGAPVPAQGTPGAAFPQPVSDALDWMKKNASWLAPTAVGAAGMLRKPPAIPNQEQLQALGTEGAGVAKQLISQYQSGQLMPGQQASLDQLTQQTKNQIRQYFASIHQSDSTAAMQAEAQVDQQATMMKQQMLDQALSQGLTAIGVAQGPLNTIANYQLQQDTALRQAFGQFAGALGNAFGRQAGSTATPTPTGTPSQPTGTVTSAPPPPPAET